jgi:hypothetical protein
MELAVIRVEIGKAKELLSRAKDYGRFSHLKAIQFRWDSMYP